MPTSSSDQGDIPGRSSDKRIIGNAATRWIWAIAALVSLGIVVSGAGYWWFNQGAGAAILDGEVSGEPAQVLDPQQVARGEALYQMNCLQCHGVRGEGNPNWRRQNSDDTYPPPPHNSTGHTWHHADGLLYRIIRDGGTIYETPGFKSGMPAFGDRLKDDEIRAVITYLKSLWEPGHRASQAEVSLQDPFP
jgi:mono/diheme cytochrome c family protein